MRRNRKHFTLTETHLGLLGELNICEYHDTYDNGVPCIDYKRPLGNQDSIDCVLKFLGEKKTETHDGDEFWTKEQGERARKLLSELTAALQIVLSNLGNVSPGVYVKASDYGQAWVHQE